MDSLDEPDARAAMIWIVGEYAERIDNADELLESFLEGFHDESTQVSSLLSCVPHLFRKIIENGKHWLVSCVHLYVMVSLSQGMTLLMSPAF